MILIIFVEITNLYIKLYYFFRLYFKSGTVPEISTSVDMNVSYETEWIEK